jgi:tetratricopeptide (TPR) repeat protein
VAQASPPAQRGKRRAGPPIIEACLFAALVGAVAYGAGLRKGYAVGLRKAKELPQAGATEMPAGHEHGMQAPGSAGAMDAATLRSKLAQIDDRERLLGIADRHLDEARLALRAEDVPGAERRFQIAAAAYQRALELGPDDADVLTDLGIALRGLHDPEGAVARFRQATEADASHVQSRFNLGLVLLTDLGRAEAAADAWEEYLRVAPKTDPERQFVERELSKLQAED